MKISSVQQGINPNFNATIVRTIPIRMFMDSMERRPNAEAQKALWSNIEKAVSKHPSDIFIFSKVDYLYGQKNTVRGVLDSNSYYYLNRTKKSSPFFALWNTWKDILDPKNQEEFHKLFGTKYKPQYQEWWDKNIAPIWEELSKIY